MNAFPRTHTYTQIRSRRYPIRATQSHTNSTTQYWIATQQAHGTGRQTNVSSSKYDEDVSEGMSGEIADYA